MAKGQKRSGREAKKPKAEAKKPALSTLNQPGKVLDRMAPVKPASK